MFVRQYGDGARAFLCLHGWSGDSGSFRALESFMPGDARLLMADLPGCGRSPEPRDWSLGAITRQIARCIETTDSSSVTLVGNCIGALLGLCVARERPELVNRLILIDAFARWPWYFRVFTHPVWGSKAYTVTFANPVGRWITNQALANRRSGESDLTDGFVRTRHDVQRRYLEVLGEIESAGQFASIRTPVDVVFGARSFREVRRSALMWQQMWPQARVWELPEAGHLLLNEAPARLSDIVFREGGIECNPSVLISTSTGI